MSQRKRTGCFFAAAAIGMITGILTLIGQKHLPNNLNFLANSASMWLIPAFLVPCFMRGDKKQSVVIGVTVLTFCVLGYYFFEAGYNHHSFFINGRQLLWLCCAVIGGVVFGLCGNLARTKTGISSYISMNILPAVFVTEASSKLFHVNDYRHMIYGLLLQISIGIMLYAIINRKNALKMKNILSFIVLVIFGSIAFEMLWRFS